MKVVGLSSVTYGKWKNAAWVSDEKGARRKYAENAESAEYADCSKLFVGTFSTFFKKSKIVGTFSFVENMPRVQNMPTVYY